MTSGIGIDIIEIQRVEVAIERRGQPFLDRIFTKREQEYCNRYRNASRRAAAYAARFAAKEAVVKALGMGFGADVIWHDIEILNEESGKPFAVLQGSARKGCAASTLNLSISHCRTYATAAATLTPLSDSSG